MTAFEAHTQSVFETFTQDVANQCLYSAMLAATDGYGITAWQGKMKEESPVVFYSC